MADHSAEYANEYAQEHVIEKLLMVAANNCVFVGKYMCLPDQSFAQAVLDCEIVLEDAVEVTKFMTPNGIAIQGTLVGTIIFECEDLIICDLDSKSMYYAEFHRIVFGLSVVSTMPISSQKHN